MAWCKTEKCLEISLISSTPDPWSLDFLHSALSAKFSNETIMYKFLHHLSVPTENMVQSLVAFFILGFHSVSEYNQVPLPWSNFYYVFLGTCGFNFDFSCPIMQNFPLHRLNNFVSIYINYFQHLVTAPCCCLQHFHSFWAASSLNQFYLSWCLIG